MLVTCHCFAVLKQVTYLAETFKFFTLPTNLFLHIYSLQMINKWKMQAILHIPSLSLLRKIWPGVVTYISYIPALQEKNSFQQCPTACSLSTSLSFSFWHCYVSIACFAIFSRLKVFNTETRLFWLANYTYLKNKPFPMTNLMMKFIFGCAMIIFMWPECGQTHTSSNTNIPSGKHGCPKPFLEKWSQNCPPFEVHCLVITFPFTFPTAQSNFLYSVA